MSRRDRVQLDCEQALARLDEHLDAEPGAAVDGDLAAHLERCPSCRAELELAETLRRELAGLPQFDVPPRVIDAARRRIDADTDGSSRREARHRRLPPAWAALAAASIAALAVTAALILPSRPEQPAADVARATAEARLAFALIADATERAEHELRDSVLRDRVLAAAVRGFSSTFRLRSRLTEAGSDPTPTVNRGGST